MERFQGKVAVVTGASAGIGEAICVKLVEAGMKVVGFARRMELVDDLAKKLSGKPGKLYGYRCDVTKEDQIKSAFKWIRNSLGPIHVLVNNAGIARPTTLINGSTEEWKKVIDTNLLGLTICTREAIAQMQEEKIAGQIVQVSSVAGHYVPQIAWNNIYPATKHAVRALTETFRQELNMIDSQIKISIISPGMVATDIVTANNFVLDGVVKEAYDACPKLRADDVADGVLYIIGTPPTVHIQDLIIRPTGEKL